MPEQSEVRLLVVDDEIPIMAALRNTLRDEGYRVTGAASGEEALAVLRQGETDLLITDLVMPRMDGIALLSQALAVDPMLVAIVMTGHGSIPTAVEAMRAGAIDYVLKPLKLNALLPALERGLMIRRLRAKNAELEKRVRERTAELEAANRELEAFSYSVSHDLRTPLRAISGFTDILLDHHGTALPPEARRQLGLIREGTSQMSRLISDLLELARVGRQPLARKTVDMEHLFREVFQSLAGECSGRRVEWRLQPLPKVSGDRVLLRLVAANLLSNALKYSRLRDPAVVEVGAAPQPGVAGPVLFVRDNGVGFDPQHADRLFEVFHRLHHAHEFEGTGVGLATVRRVVERHGGRVWAQAAPDAGATFFFTLPGSIEGASAQSEDSSRD